jgi:type II secretory pathway pseudopilin PulG
MVIFAKMRYPLRKVAGFSLVEIVIALGVAAFALVAVMGMLPMGLKTQQASIQQTTANEVMAAILNDLRADVVLPPGQASKEQDSGFGLHGHWALVAVPDTLFFNNAGNQTGSVAQGTFPTAPSDAVFRAKITYLFPPTATTSVANVTITWPAQVDPTIGLQVGSVGTYIAVNR